MNNKEKIRIFVDAHTFDSEFQGSRTFIKEIYSLLSQKETLELYIGAYDTDQLEKSFPGINTIHFIKFKNRSSVLRLLFDIPAIIKKYRIRYAHFQYIIPVYKNCKYIVTIHDVLFREFPGEFSFFYRLSKTILYTIGAKRANILTTDSAYSKKSIQKYLGIEENKIHLIPIAVNDTYFTPYDKATAKAAVYKKYGVEKFILYVSRIEPRKNHALLLQSFIDLQLYLQGYHLVLLGHESIKTPAFDKIMNGLPQNIKSFLYIKSDIPDEDLLLFYRAATVFVYPSKAEGFGIPPLEAAAAKTPVLCSNTSAMSDFSFFGENHINPYSPESLKTSLLNTLNNPPDEITLSGIADTIQQRYSWQQSADNLHQLILDDNKRTESNL